MEEEGIEWTAVSPRTGTESILAGDSGGEETFYDSEKEELKMAKALSKMKADISFVSVGDNGETTKVKVSLDENGNLLLPPMENNPFGDNIQRYDVEVNDVKVSSKQATVGAKVNVGLSAAEQLAGFKKAKSAQQQQGKKAGNKKLLLEVSLPRERMLAC